MEVGNTIPEDNQALISKQKGYLLPILGVILLIIIGGGAYFLGRNIQSNLEMQKATPVLNNAQTPSAQQAPPSIITNSLKIAPSPTSTPNPTVSWKTYSNQKYGYSVKYPSNLQTNESETSYNQYVELTLGRDSSGNAYLPNYTVTVAKDDFQAKDPASVNFMSADWTNSFYNMNVGDTKTADTATFKKLPSEKVDGQNAVVIQVVAAGSNQKRYLLKKNGYVYMISDFSNSADFQNFLSTFKFQ